MHNDQPQSLVEVIALPAGIVVERDVMLAMDDGVRLCANLFRPETPGRVPVLVALTPYGKDDRPERHSQKQDLAWQTVGMTLGRVRISECTAWESPDPGYWVPNGYAVLHVDLRGFFKSEGKPRMFSRTEVGDYLQIIEWAGTQPFSNGNVGLSGVSYLAIAQWFAAAHNPPHLKAISPWEGASDPYRDIMFHGGVPETAFLRLWSMSTNKGANDAQSASAAATPPPTAPIRTPLLSEIPLNLPKLEDIAMPALVCGSFSDQGLHTKGSFDGYARIGSTKKWLYTHGGGKWERYYGEEALAYQRTFFDRFLKGIDNGADTRPSVRLEVRVGRDEFEVRDEAAWPLASTVYQPVYLDARDAALSSTKPLPYSVASYDARQSNGVCFDLRFTERTEITGHMKLKLWVSTSEGDDMDLMVGVQKFDAQNRQVHFWGTEKDPNGIVAKGWLRVSHRTLDEKRSTPYQPVLTHDRECKLTANEIVSVEIEILPSSTLFAAGERLRLVVSGTDPFSTPFHRHEQLCNRGLHTIHTGGGFDSHLLLPVIR